MVLAGTPTNEGTKLLKERRVGLLLESLEKSFDYILMDIPPITESVDSALVAELCDGALLIVEAGKTDADFAQKTAGRFESAGCPVLGVVLNDFNPRVHAYGGYYRGYYRGYSYKYGYGNDAKQGKRKKREKQRKDDD